MIKLIATDLDGTFLTPQHTFDKELFLNLLVRCEEQGILFTVASGRPMLNVQTLFEDVLDRIAIIAENGAVVSYKGQLIFEKLMDRDQYLSVANQLESISDCQGYLLSGRQGAYASLDVSDTYFKHVSRYYSKTQKADLELVRDDIYKLTAQFSDELVIEHSRLLTESNPGLSAVVTGFGGMDIILETINKATGLEALCDFLDLDTTSVIAFGDNFNDAEMLELAGKAIATENARQGIKDLADEVIGSCKEGAVLKYIEGLVK